MLYEYGSVCTIKSKCRSVSKYGLICKHGFCNCTDTAYFDGITCSKKFLMFCSANNYIISILKKNSNKIWQKKSLRAIQRL